MESIVSTKNAFSSPQSSHRFGVKLCQLLAFVTRTRRAIFRDLSLVNDPSLYRESALFSLMLTAEESDTRAVSPIEVTEVWTSVIFSELSTCEEEQKVNNEGEIEQRVEDRESNEQEEDRETQEDGREAAGYGKERDMEKYSVPFLNIVLRQGGNVRAADSLDLLADSLFLLSLNSETQKEEEEEEEEECNLFLQSVSPESSPRRLVCVFLSARGFLWRRGFGCSTALCSGM
ncbi:hypothetical protein NQZ68_022694 [Dissostichus eleginoides]|nr:hypothetical protein NQZ68_022694 [Dissostichus eleginoides]